MLNSPRFLLLEIPNVGASVLLDPEESAHCARVLRMEVGESVCLIDGRGSIANARITTVHAKHTQVTILHKESYPQKSRITLAFGLTKPPAMEHIFKKCTELGILAFQPLITDHSLHPQSWNSERWRKIIIEACKQCQDPWVPEMRDPVKLKDWLMLRNSSSPLFFCDENNRKNEIIAPDSKEADLLIGPEGGWSDLERKELIKTNAFLLGLGPNRLRSETACVVSLTLVKSILGELK